MVRILQRIVLVAFVLSSYWSLAQTHVVISEVYGGGGNTNAPYKNDFVELYNPTSSDIIMTNWSVQYGATASTGTWSGVTTVSGTIKSNGYFLIKLAGGSVGSDLPTAEITNTSVNMSATTGKVALTTSTTVLSGTIPVSADLIDLIGFGTANGFEGALSPAPSNTTSVERKIPCSDTDNNANDFRAIAPNPQNSLEIISAANFTSGYPKSQTVTATGFQVVANFDKIGIAYFVILPAGATAPTSAQVRSGQDGSGVSLGSDFIGTIAVTSVATEFSATISNLTADTSYDVYVVAERCILQSSPVKIQTTTISAADITPPVYTVNYPKIQNITGTGLQLASSMNESGKTYFVVLPGDAAAPSPAQVKAGQNADGTSLSANLSGNINLANPNGEYITNISSLTSATNYSVYFISEDLQVNPNLQSAVVKVDVSIPAYFTEAFNDCNGTASFTSFSVTGDQVWGCVDFGYNGTKAIRMNGFAGSAVVNEDWLISPPINLSAGAALSFYSQFSFAGNGLQLKVSTDYSGAGSPSAATWTDLNGSFPTVSVGSTSTSLSDWTLSNVDLSAYASSKVYIAFVYTSTSAAASRWTLDEINVSNAVASYLSVSPSGLQFNTAGSKKNYTLKGVNLTGNVAVTAPSDFQISKDNTSFGSSLTFTATEANASPLVYVQFTGTGPQNYSGVITHTSAGVSAKTLSVSAVDKSKSFNISAYNLEFFGSNIADGSSEYGPVDDALQVSNVTTVMQTIGSDIFSVEEVSDDASMDQLVAGLPGYSKLMADRWSYSFNGPDPTFPAQKIGIVYKTSSVQVVSSRVMFSKLFDDVRAAEATSVTAALALLPGYPSSGGNTPSNFWSSGRLPFMVTADVTVNSVKKRIKVIVLHSKSGSAQADYDRRKYDVKVLYDSLTAHNANDNIIILGDFNDDVDTSINTGSASTYKVFVDDAANFNVLTYPLSQAGGYSFPSSSSFLDHIVISNELAGDYIANSTIVEDPRTYIASYTTTTSDHLPVSARFALSKASQLITFTAPSAKTLGGAPFALSATSSSGLAVNFTTTSSDKITLSGSQVTMVKAGSVAIKANQAGNESYNATSVEQSFCINPAKPTVTLSNGNTESPLLTSSAAAGNQWYLNGATIAGATNASYTASAPGVYKVQVKADNCASEFSADASVIITAIEPATSGKISIYPNPVEDYLVISGLIDNGYEASITDMTGRTVNIHLEKQNSVHTADVKSLTTGLYVARIRQGNGVQQVKFIKK